VARDRTGRGREVALAFIGSEGTGDAAASKIEQFAEVEFVYLNSLVRNWRWRGACHPNEPEYAFRWTKA